MTHYGRGDVSMRLDPAGNDHHAGGIYDTADLVGQRARSGHSNYLFTLNRNVPFPDPHRSYNLSALYDQVQHFRDLQKIRRFKHT